MTKARVSAKARCKNCDQFFPLETLHATSNGIYPVCETCLKTPNLDALKETAKHLYISKFIGKSPLKKAKSHGTSS
jgi:hypothetical protein